jgi:glutathione-regulated potassium-efflux system protein KefB
LLVRAYDRRHAIEIMAHGPDEVIRETFESALVFGRVTLEALGQTREAAEEFLEDVRKRDLARLEMQIAGDLKSGAHLSHKQAVRESVKPTPLDAPQQKSKGLTAETQDLLDKATAR